MIVCIEKTADGQFAVYQENEPAAPAAPGQQPGMMGESPAMEAAEQQNKQPARDLQDALNKAGQMLSQDQGQGGESPFDAGLKSVLPVRGGGLR